MSPDDGWYRCRFCGEDVELDLWAKSKEWDEVFCIKCSKSTLYPAKDRENHRLRKDTLGWG